MKYTLISFFFYQTNLFGSFSVFISFVRIIFIYILLYFYLSFFLIMNLVSPNYLPLDCSTIDSVSRRRHITPTHYVKITRVIKKERAEKGVGRDEFDVGGNEVVTAKSESIDFRKCISLPPPPAATTQLADRWTELQHNGDVIDDVAVWRHYTAAAEGGRGRGWQRIKGKMGGRGSRSSCAKRRRGVVGIGGYCFLCVLMIHTRDAC